MTAEPPLIEATDVTLAYAMAHDKAGTIKEYTFQMLRRQVSTEEFWALKGVDLTVRRGETFALIGPNGAGKTTLMKIVARVLPPTGGRVIVRGVVAPMIALGAGFNQEMNAAENIVLFGTLMGRDPDYMRERVRPIVEWADLAEFLDVPIRSYSSGMLARLAFAVATDVDPDVLVVDEVLAVGDEAFQKKSFERMAKLMSGGTAVLLVSHQLDQVEEMADRVMWLHKGEVTMVGDPK
ncbi:MAG TPA: ATP-binding cassette domain-containing protein, partial [Acidimicrobiia bacterium]|nr:ATP-binding cassette domain-containing protein [Acidimicrobiia bacterium]